MMLKKLVKLLALSVFTKGSEIIEVTLDNPPNKALAGFEFAVINFYDDSSTSIEVKKIFADAMQMFKEEEKLGSRSVGWA